MKPMMVLDRWVQAQPVRQLKVQAGCVEAGAGGHDKVSDSGCVALNTSGIQARHRQVQGAAHRTSSGWRYRGTRRAGRSRRYPGVPDRDRGEEGIAVLDLAPVRHPAEQLAQSFVRQQQRRVLNELVMDIMGRNRRPDRVDVGRWLEACGIRAPACQNINMQQANVPDIMDRWTDKPARAMWPGVLGTPSRVPTIVSPA